MDAGATGAAKATGSWVLAIVDSVTAETPIAISRAMNDAIKAEHISEFVTPTFEALNHGMMLGALDGAYEADTNNTIDAAALSPPEVELSHRLASSTSTTYRVLGFSNMTYESALDQFLERKVLTRASFDALTEKARRRAFTIAGTSKIQIIKTAQRELARQVALGADLSNFRKVVAQRLESAGWTPASRSHVETIFRTNVANTYQAGHWEHRASARRTASYTCACSAQTIPRGKRLARRSATTAAVACARCRVAMTGPLILAYPTFPTPDSRRACRRLSDTEQDHRLDGSRATR
jgi:hypothetical protein